MIHMSNVTPATAASGATAFPVIDLPDEPDHTLLVQIINKLG